MSKIIDNLKKAENQKNGGKYSQPIENPQTAQREESVILAAQNTQRPAEKKHADYFEPEITSKATPKFNWMVVLLIVVGLFLLVGMSSAIVLMSKNYSKANTNTSAKLARLEELLNKNNQQFAAFSKQLVKQEQVLDKLGRQEQDNQTLTSQLEKKVNAQAASIENLTKAKKTLFNRVGALESGANTTTTNENIKK